jgi:hypothetical protein
VKGDKVLYAHASRILHHETNPGCARALMQKHGERYIWVNPPAIPLSTEEMDSVFALPYKRVPHPSYGDARIPAYEMIRFSINIMRGCFGGCSFCSPSMRGVSFRAVPKIRSSMKSKRFATRFPALPALSPILAARRPTCICCAASRRAPSRPAAACHAFIRISARIWTPTMSRRLILSPRP